MVWTQAEVKQSGVYWLTILINIFNSFARLTSSIIYGWKMFSFSWRLQADYQTSAGHTIRVWRRPSDIGVPIGIEFDSTFKSLKRKLCLKTMITNHTLLIKIKHVLLKSLIALFNDFPGNASGMCVFDLRQQCKLDICTRSIFWPIYAKTWKVYLKCIYSMHTPQAEETQSIRKWNKLFLTCLFFQLLINILNIIHFPNICYLHEYYNLKNRLLLMMQIKSEIP